MRPLGEQDAHLTELVVATHRTRNELIQHYKADMQNLESGLLTPHARVSSPQKLAAELHSLTPAVSHAPLKSSPISQASDVPPARGSRRREAEAQVCTHHC